MLHTISRLGTKAMIPDSLIVMKSASAKLRKASQNRLAVDTRPRPFENIESLLRSIVIDVLIYTNIHILVKHYVWPNAFRQICRVQSSMESQVTQV